MTKTTETDNLKTWRESGIWPANAIPGRTQDERRAADAASIIAPNAEAMRVELAKERDNSALYDATGDTITGELYVEEDRSINARMTALAYSPSQYDRALIAKALRFYAHEGDNMGDLEIEECAALADRIEPAQGGSCEACLARGIAWDTPRGDFTCYECGRPFDA